MKSLHYPFLVITFVLFFSCGEKPVGASSESLLRFTVVDAAGKPTPALTALCLVLNVPLSTSPTRLEAVQQTQRAWLRPAGLERWQVSDPLASRRSELLPFFEKLRMLEAITPQKKSYDYLLVLGGTARGLRERLSYAAGLYHQGIRWQRMVFLTGERALDSEYESLQVIYHPDESRFPLRPGWQEPVQPPKTEADLVRLVWDQLIVDASLRVLPFDLVCSRQQRDGKGCVPRPNRGDTLRDWRAQFATAPGSCLVISSQPHVGYEDAVFRTYLSSAEGWNVETVGPACNVETVCVAEILDALARWLYQENCRIEKSC